MWRSNKKNIFLRKVQRSNEHSLKINLPKRYVELNHLERGDLMRCNIMRLSNGSFVLCVDKLEVE